MRKKIFLFLLFASLVLTPQSGYMDSSLPEIKIFVNSFTFHTRDTLSLSISLNNPGVKMIVDVYVGFLLPNGGLILFDESFKNLVPCNVSDSTTFTAAWSAKPLPSGYSLPLTKVFSIVLPAIPDGTYTAFAALAESGSAKAGSIKLIGEVSMIQFSFSHGTGNKSAQEVGDAIYRFLSVWWILPDDDHAGLYYRYEGGDPSNPYSHWVIHIPGPGNTVKIARIPEFVNWKDLDYWGAHMATSNGKLPFKKREKILATALMLTKANIGYVGTNPYPSDILEPVDYEEWVGSISQIRGIRCDGVVEYCYEKNGIMVWGKGQDPNHYDITVPSNLREHNDLTLPGLNPRYELTPRVQRGVLGLEYTNMRASRPEDPTKVSNLVAKTHDSKGKPINPQNKKIVVQWKDATDEQSGIWGYYIKIDSSSNSIPDYKDIPVRKVSLEPVSGSVFPDRPGYKPEYESHDLPDGKYYVHIRSIDNAGNWGEDSPDKCTAHLGPLCIGECIIITNEAPTGVIQEKRPTISATIKSLVDVDIDLTSIQMTLEGSLIAHSTSGSGPEIWVSYTPDYDLAEGEHTVTANAKDVNGVAAEEKVWTFVIGECKWFEGWESASVGTYPYGTFIQGDTGEWYVNGEINTECPQVALPKAKILVSGEGKYLQLTFQPPFARDCTGNIGVENKIRLDIPITNKTILYFKEFGEFGQLLIGQASIGQALKGGDKSSLTRKGYYPCYDCAIRLAVADNQGHIIVYALQKLNLEGWKFSPLPFTILLGEAGGIYTRNLLEDFKKIRGFNPSEAKITSIGFLLPVMTFYGSPIEPTKLSIATIPAAAILDSLCISY